MLYWTCFFSEYVKFIRDPKKNQRTLVRLYFPSDPKMPWAAQGQAQMLLKGMSGLTYLVCCHRDPPLDEQQKIEESTSKPFLHNKYSQGYEHWTPVSRSFHFSSFCALSINKFSWHRSFLSSAFCERWHQLFSSAWNFYTFCHKFQRAGSGLSRFCSGKNKITLNARNNAGVAFVFWMFASQALKLCLGARWESYKGNVWINANALTKSCWY